MGAVERCHHACLGRGRTRSLCAFHAPQVHRESREDDLFHIVEVGSLQRVLVPRRPRQEGLGKGESMRKWRISSIALIAAVMAVSLVMAGTSNGKTGRAGGAAAAAGPVTINFWQQKFEDYQQAWFTKYVKAF